MRTGLYLQLEESGHQIIARIRTKESVHSWAAFWTHSDAENWARNEYTKIQIAELDRLRAKREGKI